MGARLRFILKNRRPPVSFFVSVCKGTQCVWPILIKLRTVDLHYSCECEFCLDYFKGHICARSSCYSGTCVKRNPYRTEYRLWRITLTVVMIFNLISRTCINLKFSAAEKKIDPLWLCYRQVSLCRYCIFLLCGQILTKFCIGGAYACVTTFKLSSRSF